MGRKAEYTNPEVCESSLLDFDICALIMQLSAKKSIIPGFQNQFCPVQRDER